MTKRLEEIDKLINERDKYADVDGEKDYPNYDEQIFLLNDEGHIDYLVKRVKELEKELNAALYTHNLQAEKIQKLERADKVKQLEKQLETALGKGFILEQRNHELQKALQYYGHKCHINFSMETGELEVEDGEIARNELEKQVEV